jgi:hypothetical protein
VLGAFFCNFFIAARQPESRSVGRAPAYQILWVRGFRAHTISGRGFNLFKALRRHFRATPLCRQTLSRRGTFCAIESIPSKDLAAAGARHREQTEATQTRGLQLRLCLDTCSPCRKLRPLVPLRRHVATRFTRAYRTWARGCTKAKALGGLGHAGSCHEF